MEGMKAFHICSLSVLSSAAGTLPAVAVATCRAGGVGIVDIDNELRESTLSRAHAVVKSLISLIDGSEKKPFGLRFSAENLSSVESIAAATGLVDIPHWYVVGQWRPGDVLPPPSPQRKIWLEITAVADIQRLLALGIMPDGWLARGAESGGLCGAESTFVLAQTLARQELPFLLQGGLGVRGCVACRVAGASGAMLDDALLLLAESPVRTLHGATLRRMGGEDTALIGEELGLRVRVPNRPELQAARALQEFAAQMSIEEGPDDEQTAKWIAEVHSKVGWGAAQSKAWPVGQAVGLAKIYEARYRTTGRLIQAAIQATSDASLETIAAARALAPQSTLAQVHRTRYPVVQGPMTRVSDTQRFAAAVSGAGALPLVALAMFRGEEAEALLQSCAEALGDASWGAGILAFLPAELRQQQMAAMARIRPPFALLAGGLPEQVRALEAQGTATYLHAPSPALLSAFLAQGVRRFVFEGAECGGHAGPLHSLPLWELAVETLLAEIPADGPESVHVLFAGGIHDPLSAAMVAAMAHPLVERGVRIGVLAGTAYLFTEEAVQCGAIVEQFQTQAVSCDGIVQLCTGPGHVINCANTPFSERFKQERRRLRREGTSPREITAKLEDLMMGRSRIAAKGQGRNDNDGTPCSLDEQEQLSRGIYMMGQVAALRKTICSVAQLHCDLSEGSAEFMQRYAERPKRMPARKADVPIAIIGAACLLPGAHTVEAFWRNMLGKVCSIREIPEERFDWRLYFDEDRDAPDRIYSRWGTFLDKIAFDPVRYGIPPHSLSSISVVQLLTLEACWRALEDARFGESGFDRENTAVVLGTDGMADLHHGYIARAMLPSLLPGSSEEIYQRLPSWTEESFAGILSNVAAGRVANRLDLRGPNYSVDAACASSLAALQLGMRELERGDSNVAVVAGAEFGQNPYGYLAFSKTRALSPTGRARPFDSKADGIVLGEGVVALVLRRLEDAEREGDRVYAVIRSVAGSSDGRAMGLTAPRSEGQQLAMQRAYACCGVSPSSLGMYEAHGTGTVVGDKTELTTVSSILNAAGAIPGQCVLGSAKGLIGHTKAAAGLAGVLKAALALHHKTLPPHAPIDSPLPGVSQPGSPVRVLEDAQAWTAPRDGPRRAGVSAFGFGGTNFHAVLEEHSGALATPAMGGDLWPVELFLFGAQDVEGLLRQLRSVRTATRRNPRLTLRDLAASVCPRRDNYSAHRIALLASDSEELATGLQAAEELLLQGKATIPAKVFYGTGDMQGTMAFVFPGQGSQYPGMGAQLGVYLPEMRRAYDDIHVFSAQTADRVKHALLPAQVFDEKGRQSLASMVQATEVAQPALAIVIAGMLEITQRLGMSPAVVGGHSFGEFAALHAAGALSREAFLSLSEARGHAMAQAASEATGTMAAVDCSREEIEEWLAQLPGLTLANHNTPKQCVVSGNNAVIESALVELAKQGITARRLAVGAAFHSPAMSPAAAAVRAAIERVDVRSPQVTVTSNVSGAPYPAEASAVCELLSQHLESRVEFVAQIEAMYAGGARVFVEVGPKSVLSGLIARILERREHLAISLDGSGGGLRGLLAGIARLFSHGVSMDVNALFEDRPVQKINLEEVSEPVPDRWYIDGGRVWAAAETHGRMGEQPLLTVETRDAARSAILPASDFGGSSALQAYSEYQKTMRSFLESQEHTLETFLDGLQGARSAPSLRRAFAKEDAPLLTLNASAPDTVSAAPAAPAAPSGSVELTLSSVAALFTRLVAERTGYEPELILPELDLETELGIDSIKRIEVLATAEGQLPAAVQENFRRAMDRLTQTRTIHGLAKAVLAMETRTEEPTSAVQREEDICPRLVMRAHSAPLIEDGESRLSGLYLITKDSRGIADAVCSLLRAHGADAMAIDAEALAEPKELRRRIEAYTAKFGLVQGILHLLPLDCEDGETTLAAWQIESQKTVEGLFHLLQASGEQVAVAIALTGFGGLWARDKFGPGLLRAATGGVHGVLRTFAAETGALTRVIDIDRTLEPKEVATIVIDELLYGSADAGEIGYSEGERLAFMPEPEEVDPQSTGWKPTAGSVILLTGGARGITALAAEDLAVPGVHLVLLGRDAIDETTVSGREKIDTLHRLRELGALPEYHAIDVCSETEFGGLIDDLYRRFGKIDAVIHGAGRIADKLIRDKSTESFREIFATKADSTFLLRSRLQPDQLKLVVLFGSISGRFGNFGQADYAAGNEVLNRLAWNMAATWPNTHVASINWGPWKDSGMASSAVLRLLETRGILPISKAAGREFLLTEIDRGEAVEVIAGAGPWMATKPVPEEDLSLAEETQRESV
jgi:acyl transferase domain-containing protein/NAD(P)H-dependent flavin oxidoreductase YrpB (nitropropane dioxygenase family)/NAD(P)-dependent dehydrogenase (short-subunit alcohol dehydrogenase family)